jgi:hypothetical protein
MTAQKSRTKPQPKKHTDDKLDRALEETFPASDPVSFIEPARKEPDDKFDKNTSRSRGRKLINAGF